LFEVLTNPIKSCSKLEQIRRREEEIKGKKVKLPKKKRARGEELLVMLDGIKQEQLEQAQLLRTLVSYQNLFASSSSSSVYFSEPATNLAVGNNPIYGHKEVKGDTLEQAMADFLQVVKAIPDAERPYKLQRLRNGLDSDQQSLLQEIGAVMTDLISPPQPPVINQQYIDIPSDYSSPSTHFRPPSAYTETPKILPLPEDADAIFSSALHEGVKLEEPILNQHSERPEVDFSFLEFFNPNAGMEGIDLLGDKDVELWNSTLQDFLIFQE